MLHDYFISSSRIVASVISPAPWYIRTLKSTFVHYYASKCINRCLTFDLIVHIWLRLLFNTDCMRFKMSRMILVQKRCNSLWKTFDQFANHHTKVRSCSKFAERVIAMLRERENPANFMQCSHRCEPRTFCYTNRRQIYVYIYIYRIIMNKKRITTFRITKINAVFCEHRTYERKNRHKVDKTIMII